MNNKMNCLKQAVEARGFYLRKINSNLWSINGRKFVYDRFVRVCRHIIAKYSIRQNLFL